MVDVLGKFKELHLEGWPEFLGTLAFIPENNIPSLCLRMGASASQLIKTSNEGITPFLTSVQKADKTPRFDYEQNQTSHGLQESLSSGNS